jgi:hypothetical protein
LDVASFLVRAVGMEVAGARLDALEEDGLGEAFGFFSGAGTEADLVQRLADDAGEVGNDLDADGDAQGSLGPADGVGLGWWGGGFPDAEESLPDRRTAGSGRLSELAPATGPDGGDLGGGEVGVEKGVCGRGCWVMRAG